MTKPLTNFSGPILITGAAGGLARLVAAKLAPHAKLVGVDTRDLPFGVEFPGEFMRLDYAHRRMTDVFRRHSFEGLLHLGRLSVASVNFSRSERFNVNVLGTQALLNSALRYGVKRIVVLSTFHVYGAHRHNPIHLSERDPLRAAQTFPELADAIEFDHVSRAFMHEFRRIHTVILRPVNIVGPNIRNVMTKMLRSKRCPVLMGFDPVLQFVHEEDVARAVLLGLGASTSGVYNVAGEGAVAYTKAVELAGGHPIPIPHFMAYPTVGMLSRLGLLFPKHLIDYFRFPTVVSDEAFREKFHYEPSRTTVETLRELARP